MPAITELPRVMVRGCGSSDASVRLRKSRRPGAPTPEGVRRRNAVGQWHWGPWWLANRGGLPGRVKLDGIQRGSAAPAGQRVIAERGWPRAQAGSAGAPLTTPPIRAGGLRGCWASPGSRRAGASGQTAALACPLTGDATRATRRNKSVIPRTGPRGRPSPRSRTARLRRHASPPTAKTAGRRLNGRLNRPGKPSPAGAEGGRRQGRRQCRFGLTRAGPCWEFVPLSRGSG